MREYRVYRQEKWRNEKESISQEKEWISFSTFLLSKSRVERIYVVGWIHGEIYDSVYHTVRARARTADSHVLAPSSRI